MPLRGQVRSATIWGCSWIVTLNFSSIPTVVSSHPSSISDMIIFHFIFSL